jgi:hypothetical protein
MRSIITTRDEKQAQAAERKMNVRLRKLGFPATQIRSFQKSLIDGKPDRYTITLEDGEPVDIIREFSPIF